MSKTITFDCYGTLLDTSSLTEEIQQIARENSILPDQAAQLFFAYEDRLMYGEEFRPYKALLKEVLRYMDCECCSNCFSVAQERIFNAIRHFEPFPDVLPALKKLKAAGWRLILMSNTEPEFMEEHLKALDHLLDETLLASDVSCYKPDLRFFKEAEKKFDLKQADHIHIAKGYWWDITPASRLGWNKIWVNREGKQGSQKEQPYGEVRNLTEIHLILDETSLFTD